jgi:CO/xanthine dehydrogenase Mo-binding subunit
VKVHRFDCAVDCGRPINPDGVRAQLESAVIYALTATLKNSITIANGAVEQGNFNDYDMLRMKETPTLIAVHIVPSTVNPTGTGEPCVPVVAPAVCNAIFAATGKRLRRLPIRSADFA